jgi:hypothetical protein
MVSDTSLIRLIAGSNRELTANMDLSPLQAIDRLQKLHERYKDAWAGSPWIVLPGSDTRKDGKGILPATMPVPEMLDAIKEYGAPCGIVGLAVLSDRTARVLKIHFRKEAKCRKAVDVSANTAWEMYLAAARRINPLFDSKKGN